MLDEKAWLAISTSLHTELVRFELFSLVDEGEILVICPDHEWFTVTLEPVMPFFQNPFEGQHVSVPHPIALLDKVAFSGDVVWTSLR